MVNGEMDRGPGGVWEAGVRRLVGLGGGGAPGLTMHEQVLGSVRMGNAGAGAWFGAVGRAPHRPACVRLWCRGPGGSGGQGERSVQQSALDSDRMPSPLLLCAACGHHVTSRKDQIVVHGAHQHTFANPHGMVYRIGCFAAAPGACGSGLETSDFTWFEGYVWQVQGCGGCGVHLGWRFSRTGHQFHGLIVDRLVEHLSDPSMPS